MSHLTVEEGPSWSFSTSVSGRKIVEKPVDDRLARTLAQKLSLPDLVARLLATRVEGFEDGQSFLTPRLRDSLADPFSLKEMDKAAERLAKAIVDKEQIAIFGDYDVDGATSTAMLLRYVRHFGQSALYHIPDRIKEGYGPNEAAITSLKEKGASLLVTVDCGTLAFDQMDHAAAVGLDTIILDHHAGEARRPTATAYVNPNRPEADTSLSMLAAAGVTFMALVATNKVLRDSHGLGRDGLPDLMALLDLVALGTVADVVPLLGPNRAIVAQGLKVIDRGENTGLVALAQVAELSGAFSSEKIGFQIGPRLNAGGRLGDPTLGTRLLSTDDPSEAMGIAERLDQLNKERRSLESDMVAAALASIESDLSAEDPSGVLVVAGQGWHPGILGIVASRLKDRFHRPSIALGIDEDGLAKGSGRSVPGFDLGGAVVEAHKAGITLSGGGHPMAAGLSLEENAIGQLRDFLAEQMARSEDVAEPTIEIDACLSPGAASVELVDALDSLRPYGAGNPEPMVALAPVKATGGRVVGQNHVSVRLRGRGGAVVQGIAFRQADTPIGDALLAPSNSELIVLGRIKRDNFRGETRIQLQIEDVGTVL